MDITPNQYVERLTTISSKKIVLLREMMELTGTQADMIAEDRIEALNLVIEHKHHIIEKIDKLDDEFEIYFSRFKSVLGINNLDELRSDSGIVGLKDLQENVSGIMELLNKLTAKDRLNVGMANTKLDSIGGEIKKTNQGRKLAAAYMQTPVQSVSFYLDRKK